MIGVEPTWITPPDPKSGASANFATSGKGCKAKGLQAFLRLKIEKITAVMAKGMKNKKSRNEDPQRFVRLERPKRFQNNLRIPLHPCTKNLIS